jgi:hypothetical protein
VDQRLPKHRSQVSSVDPAQALAAVDRTSVVASETAGAKAFAIDVAETCSRRLGAIVVSAILNGSLALGDYVPEQSDIDLLLIVDRPPSDPEVETLVHAVVGTRKRAALRVDLRVVTEQVAIAPPEMPPMELYVGLGVAGQQEIVPKCSGEPDVVVELSLCRACGNALLGTRRARSSATSMIRPFCASAMRSWPAGRLLRTTRRTPWPDPLRSVRPV